MIPEVIKNRIEIKFGKLVRYPKDCEALATAISKNCGDRISSTTLKRLFGMVKNVKQPRMFTLDIIAQYAGFDSWESAINEDVLNENSFFENKDQIIISQLKPHEKIKLKYSPDRILRIEYLGEKDFKVIESSKSKLFVGDLLTILRLEKSFPLVCENVIRDGKTLGKFIGGEKEGILHLSIDA